MAATRRVRMAWLQNCSWLWPRSSLSQALQDGNGSLTLNAFIWLVITLVCAGASLICRRISIRIISKKVLWGVLGLGLVLQILQLLTNAPGIFLSAGYQHQFWQFQVCIIIGAICALVSLAPKAWLPAWVRIGLIALVFITVLMAGVWIIHTSPSPVIDVYMFQQTSSGRYCKAIIHTNKRPPIFMRTWVFMDQRWLRTVK